MVSSMAGPRPGVSRPAFRSRDGVPPRRLHLGHGSGRVADTVLRQASSATRSIASCGSTSMPTSERASGHGRSARTSGSSRSSRRSTWHAASMPATRGSSSGRCSSPHGMASRSGRIRYPDPSPAPGGGRWRVDPPRSRLDRVPGRCRGGVRGRCRRGADASSRAVYNGGSRSALAEAIGEGVRRVSGELVLVGLARSALLDGVGLRACRSRPRRSPIARTSPTARSLPRAGRRRATKPAMAAAQALSSRAMAWSPPAWGPRSP